MSFIRKIRNGLYRLSDDTLYDVNDIQTEISLNQEVLNFIVNCRRLRNGSETDIIKAFESAYSCNSDTALKALFYIRDIKGGLGERRVFKVILCHLANNNPVIIKKNLENIVHYGRFDDLYSLFYTQSETDVINFIKNQIELDLNTNSPSTLCKWLKSENCSSKESKQLATRTRKLLGYSSKEYRKLLTSLRSKLFIIEKELSTKNYSNIDYSKLSYQNLLRYRSTFIRNDKEKYSTYLEELTLKKGISYNSIQEINTLPIISGIIDRVNDIYNDNIYPYNKLWDLKLSTLDPNSMQDIVILDVDNYKNLKPSLSLKVGIAYILLSKNLVSHKFKNYYMYYNNIEKSKFGKVEFGNVFDEVSSILMNKSKHRNDVTSLLELLLFTYIKKGLTSNDLPDRVVIISDKDTYLEDYIINYEKLIDDFKKAGLTLPNVLFWYPEIKNRSLIIKNTSTKIIHGFSEELSMDILYDKFDDLASIIFDTLHSDQYSKIIT